MKNKIIKRVLMCNPLYFSSLDYSINPWMRPGKINANKSKKQWGDLVKAYKKLGIKVEVIEQQPGSPDMVFATDQGIVNGKNVLLSRFRYKERQKESSYFERWFRENDYKISYLPEDIFFEGNGETFFWGDKIIMGVGYRSNQETSKVISDFFDREVITLQITDPSFYHLDVGFFPLNTTTAFYYPPVFTTSSQKKLKKLIPNLINFSKKEAYNFSGNSVVTDHHVVMQRGNESFEEKLKDLGYKTVPVNLSEFMKSGGGAHCLTEILHEAYE